MNEKNNKDGFDFLSEIKEIGSKNGLNIQFENVSEIKMDNKCNYGFKNDENLENSDSK